MLLSQVLKMTVLINKNMYIFKKLIRKEKCFKIEADLEAAKFLLIFFFFF